MWQTSVPTTGRHQQFHVLFQLPHKETKSYNENRLFGNWVGTCMFRDNSVKNFDYPLDF